MHPTTVIDGVEPKEDEARLRGGIEAGLRHISLVVSFPVAVGGKPRAQWFEVQRAHVEVRLEHSHRGVRLLGQPEDVVQRWRELKLF